VIALARWLSIIGHPFAMAAVLIVGTALHFGAPKDAARALMLVALVALLPVAVLMIRQVRRGAWRNVDASEVAERPLLFAVAIVALAALLGYAVVFRPGSFLIRGSLGVFGLLAACAVATRWVKVSLHMAFGALAATTLLLLGSPAGWVVLAFLPALAWSRLALGRHRLSEVAIGVFVGFLVGYAIHRF
jgi:phosphatidylserine synthase